MDHYITKNSFTSRNKHRTHLKPTKADICRQKPTCRHMPTKKPTYADQNRHMPTYADISRHMPTYADHADKSRQSDICRHMPTYADQGRPKPTQPTKADKNRRSVSVGFGRCRVLGGGLYYNPTTPERTNCSTGERFLWISTQTEFDLKFVEIFYNKSM